MGNELDGKVALVTGASRGIGRVIAIALAKAGGEVAVNFVRREAEARKVCSEIKSLGRRSLAIKAGISRPQPLDQITERDWDEILTVNLKSMFLVTQAVLPGMRKQRWGRIINLSSVAAQLGGVIGPHYAASKAGCLGLTHSYAALLAKEGITVNAIAPALIETEMITSNPKARPDIIPLGRFGTVEETADVAVMLACNGYITGQTINVNGGWYMS
jgi:3-oxoacyl-[acyl-carrier protein] reductase